MVVIMYLPVNTGKKGGRAAFKRRCEGVPAWTADTRPNLPASQSFWLGGREVGVHESLRFTNVKPRPYSDKSTRSVMVGDNVSAVAGSVQKEVLCMAEIT